MSMLNRRNALTAVATLPALAAPAAVAAMDSPDAELIVLGREFDRLALALNDCFRRSGVAHEQAEAMRIEAPDALRPKVGDRKAGLRIPESVNVDVGLYGHNDVGHIRHIDHPRAREIVQAYDLWNASGDEASKRCGCRAIEREIDLHNQEIDPIMERITALPAHTLEGMKVKARVTFYCSVGQITNEDHGSDVQSAMSIVIDLLRMQCTAPTSHEYVRVGAQQLLSRTQI
jgi:hypothetical protein